MLCFLVALGFSFGNTDAHRLSAFLQVSNCSLKVGHTSAFAKVHPLFVLSPFSHGTRFSLFSSRFSHFSSPVIHADTHPVSLHNVAFSNSMSRAVVLTAATPTEGVDHNTRKVMLSEESSLFVKCTFNAMSSVHGRADETMGGALYCQGCSVTFKQCMFSGNSAVTAGCAYFDHCDITTESCNFTNNKATYVVGCISLVKTNSKVNDCYFVGNEGEIYVGVLKAVDSTCDCEGVIFHANKAAYQSSVIDAEKSAFSFVGTQFSANQLTRELGGIVHNLRASTVRLLGCRFETALTVNGTSKHPIKMDAESIVNSVSSCFDVKSESDLRKDNEGTLTVDLGTMFMEQCPCKPVVLPAAYDIVDVNIVLHSGLVTHKFVVTALSLLATACVAAMVLVFGSGQVKTEWVALL